MRLKKKKRILKKYGITINGTDADIKRIKIKRKLLTRWRKYKEISLDGKGYEYNPIDPKKPFMSINNAFVKVYRTGFVIKSFVKQEDKTLPEPYKIEIDKNAYWREPKKIKKGLTIDPKKI